MRHTRRHDGAPVRARARPMSNDLRDLARHAALQAYAPHSGLRVGAALRSASGRTHAGCNVENASFTVGNCAERAAIAAAVLAEGPDVRLVEITVIALDRDGHALPVPPCGACRQALVEFGPEARVEFMGPDGRWQTRRAGDLLPDRFSFPRSG